MAHFSASLVKLKGSLDQIHEDRAIITGITSVTDSNDLRQEQKQSAFRHMSNSNHMWFHEL